MKTDIVRKISYDIELIRIEKEDTFNGILNKFYDVMRKYEIKKHTKKGSGWESTVSETPEWNMCYTLFVQKIKSYFDLVDYFAQLPEDLNH